METPSNSEDTLIQTALKKIVAVLLPPSVPSPTGGEGIGRGRGGWQWKNIYIYFLTAGPKNLGANIYIYIYLQLSPFPPHVVWGRGTEEEE